MNIALIFAGGSGVRMGATLTPLLKKLEGQGYIERSSTGSSSQSTENGPQ